MRQQSGFEALLEALRASGVDVGAGGGSPFNAEPVGSSSGQSDDSGRAAKQGRASRRGGSRGGAGIPSDSFSNALAQWGKKALVITAVIVIVIALAAYWWFHPPINVHSVDTWVFVAIFVLLPLFLVLRARSSAYKNGTKKVTASESKSKRFKMLSWIPLAIVIVGIVGAVMSYPIFPGNAEKYANVLQTDTCDFASDIQEVDYSEIPVIDRDSAVILGNRAMGSIPEYVSQFEISPIYSQINYQGTPVRVSPLVYADLFKWFTNREAGIPAYVVVDMTTQETQVVRLEQPILYSESEPLARNIDRYVQLKYPFYMFEEKSFEIDEDGNPWWICPVQTRTIGLFGGETISRVVLCNASTGECQDLAIDECPEWVDRAYPSDLLIQQYNWSGAYKNGWLNSIFGQQGVVQTTPGTDGQQGYNYIAKDDDVWVYTGVTSATADNSIIGFVLVNQRTAESHFYTVAGATEDSAMSSAEGQVQNLRYTATLPLLINVSGQPTYFMALKDDAGLVKQYAMLDIQRYQNVAVGNTVEECQKAYEALLATNGVLTGEDGQTAGTETITGVIKQSVQAVVEGNSHFYVTLEGDGRIFDCALPGMLRIVAYGPGDTVTFEFTEGSTTCTVSAIKEEADTAVSENDEASQGEHAGQNADGGTEAAGSEQPEQQASSDEQQA